MNHCHINTINHDQYHHGLNVIILITYINTGTGKKGPMSKKLCFRNAPRQFSISDPQKYTHLLSGDQDQAPGKDFLLPL